MIANIENVVVQVQVRVAESPRNFAREINSPAFLKALQDGSPTAERAFRDLVSHMHGPLLSFIGRWFQDTESAEDVLQETFLAVHRSLPRFEGKSRLTTWVYSLAKNKAMDCLSKKYRHGYGCGENMGAPDWEVEATEPLPDQDAHQSLLMARIRSIAETIPALYREVWLLRNVEGMSGEETAEILGIDPSLMRVRLHRARCLIVDRLRKELPGLFAELKAKTRV
ncbi:MAG: sigma-70 family RNA polymerase sigma factor [Fibrobacteria bacterium]